MADNAGKFWIMSWESHAIVLEPESLQDEVRDEAEKIVANHDRMVADRERYGLDGKKFNMGRGKRDVHENIPFYRIQGRVMRGSCLASPAWTSPDSPLILPRNWTPWEYTPI